MNPRARYMGSRQYPPAPVYRSHPPRSSGMLIEETDHE